MREVECAAEGGLRSLVNNCDFNPVELANVHFFQIRERLRTKFAIVGSFVSKAVELVVDEGQQCQFTCVAYSEVGTVARRIDPNTIVYRTLAYRVTVCEQKAHLCYDVHGATNFAVTQ